MPLRCRPSKFTHWSPSHWLMWALPGSACRTGQWICTLPRCIKPETLQPVAGIESLTFRLWAFILWSVSVCRIHLQILEAQLGHLFWPLMQRWTCILLRTTSALETTHRSSRVTVVPSAWHKASLLCRRLDVSGLLRSSPNFHGSRSIFPELPQEPLSMSVHSVKRGEVANIPTQTWNSSIYRPVV